MRRVVLLVALALAPFSEQQQQLEAEIGLIAADGSEEVLPNDETIVQYADAASTSLFCKSTVTWDQCLWRWGESNTCVYLEEEGINTCEGELSREDFNSCKLRVGTDRREAGTWTCVLIDFESQSNLTAEKALHLEYAVAAAVSVNNTEAPLTLLVGETVVLECVASGAYPGALLRWSVDGLETEVSDGNSTGEGVQIFGAM